MEGGHQGTGEKGGKADDKEPLMRWEGVVSGSQVEKVPVVKGATDCVKCS